MEGVEKKLDVDRRAAMTLELLAQLQEEIPGMWQIPGKLIGRGARQHQGKPTGQQQEVICRGQELAIRLRKIREVRTGPSPGIGERQKHGLERWVVAPAVVIRERRSDSGVANRYFRAFGAIENADWLAAPGIYVVLQRGPRCRIEPGIDADQS